MTGSFSLHRDAALRTGRHRPPKPGPVKIIRVNRALWAAALKAAGGDPRRIRIESATVVVVENNPRRPA